jgi:pimeloyl-ACP methyl ester carboxylesterase
MDGSRAAQRSLASSQERDAFVFPTSFGQWRLWLLDQMSPGQAVYNISAGLRLRGRAASADVADAPRTIEAMATAYLAEIKRAYGHWPSVLVAWSMGGLIAFEMARQLREGGVSLAALVLIDLRLLFELQPTPTGFPRFQELNAIVRRLDPTHQVLHRLLRLGSGVRFLQRSDHLPPRTRHLRHARSGLWAYLWHVPFRQAGRNAGDRLLRCRSVVINGCH